MDLFYMINLPQEVAGAFDRACHELREKGYKQCIAEEIFLSLYRTSVDIDDVAQSLKGIKGNSYRQQDIKFSPDHTCPGKRQDPVDIIKCKIVIFKEKQDQQVDADNTDQTPLLFFFSARNKQASKIGNDRGSSDEQCIFCIPSHIKIVARH